MASEGTMRSQVVRALRPLHAFPVENSILPGTPDVNYIHGWIELKYLKRWPANTDAIIKIPHYTPPQKIFAQQRVRAGGTCWFLLCVERDWILLDGVAAANLINRSTRDQLVAASWGYWFNGLKEAELLTCLLDFHNSPTANA
jgi:hypothetical protein